MITDDSLKFILQPVKLTNAFKVPSSVSSLLPAQSCPQCNFVVKDNLYVALSILFLNKLCCLYKLDNELNYALV